MMAFGNALIFVGDGFKKPGALGAAAVTIRPERFFGGLAGSVHQFDRASTELERGPI